MLNSDAPSKFVSKPTFSAYASRIWQINYAKFRGEGVAENVIEFAMFFRGGTGWTRELALVMRTEKKKSDAIDQRVSLVSHHLLQPIPDGG